jgi:hypothetical protein
LHYNSLGRERNEDTEVVCRLHHLVRHLMNLECDACGMSVDWSQSAFARAVGVTPTRVSHVIKRTRSITAELRPAVRQGARRLRARSALNGSPDEHGDDRGPARPQALGPLCPGDRAGARLAVRSGSLKKGDDDA